MPSCAPQKNHLSGLKRRLLKLSFWNEQQLAEVKRDCFPLVRRNRCGSQAFWVMSQLPAV